MHFVRHTTPNETGMESGALARDALPRVGPHGWAEAEDLRARGGEWAVMGSAAAYEASATNPEP
jgi:hypothetical protein